MSQWTKGPWHVHETTGEIADGTNVFVASVEGELVTPEEKPNARLIAAAPELYDELFRALAVITNPQAFDVEGVRADILRVLTKAKADGTAVVVNLK